VGSYVEGQCGRHFTTDHGIRRRVCFFIEGNSGVGFNLEEVSRKFLMVSVTKETIDM
jgi:hypothetical protein